MLFLQSSIMHKSNTHQLKMILLLRLRRHIQLLLSLYALQPKMLSRSSFWLRCAREVICQNRLRLTEKRSEVLLNELRVALLLKMSIKLPKKEPLIWSVFPLGSIQNWLAKPTSLWLLPKYLAIRPKTLHLLL